VTTGGETLLNFVSMNFQMRQHHGWSISELEDCPPWERKIYEHLLIKHLKEEKERLSKLR